MDVRVRVSHAPTRSRITLPYIISCDTDRRGIGVININPGPVDWRCSIVSSASFSWFEYVVRDAINRLTWDRAYLIEK